MLRLYLGVRRVSTGDGQVLSTVDDLLTAISEAVGPSAKNLDLVRRWVRPERRWLREVKAAVEQRFELQDNESTAVVNEVSALLQRVSVEDLIRAKATDEGELVRRLMDESRRSGRLTDGWGPEAVEFAIKRVLTIVSPPPESAEFTALAILRMLTLLEQQAQGKDQTEEGLATLRQLGATLTQGFDGLPAALADEQDQRVLDQHNEHANIYRVRVIETLLPKDRVAGRDRELKEIRDFLENPQEQFWWWVADAWAGKTALMADVAMFPPTNTQVSCAYFFVDGSDVNSNDREAFYREMLPQLARLGGSPDDLSSRYSSEGHFERLLRIAAEVNPDRTILLIIDGLDEDTGTGTLPSSSVARVLPAVLPPNVKLLVASRTQPVDFSDGHPLKSTQHSLSPSPHAAEFRERAELDVKMFASDPLGRDILGLLAVARGPLTTNDLTRLTRAKSASDVSNFTGRSFGRSLRSWRTDNDESAYALAHDTLHELAVTVLAKREQVSFTDKNSNRVRPFEHSELAPWRLKLAEWGDEWVENGWPADTPRYLLSQAFTSTLVRDPALREKVVPYLLDSSRTERVVAESHGSFGIINQLHDAMGAIASSNSVEDPELEVLWRLALAAEEAGRTAMGTSTALPAAIATLRSPADGIGLARSLHVVRQRVEALSLVANALAGQDLPSAVRAAEYALEAAGFDQDPATQARCYTAAIPHLTVRGLWDFAVRAMDGATEASRSGFGWEISDQLRLFSALHNAGQAVRAREAVDEVLTLLDSSFTDPGNSSMASWERMAFQTDGFLGPAAHNSRVQRKVSKLYETSLFIFDLIFRVNSMLVCATAFRKMGDSANAQAARVVAQETAPMIEWHHFRVSSLLDIAEEAAAANEPDVATEMLNAAYIEIGKLNNDDRVWLLSHLAETEAHLRLDDRALATVKRISDPGQRDRCLETLSRFWGKAENFGAARRGADSIADPILREETFVKIASKMFHAELVSEGEALLEHVVLEYVSDELLAELILAQLASSSDGATAVLTLVEERRSRILESGNVLSREEMFEFSMLLARKGQVDIAVEVLQVALTLDEDGPPLEVGEALVTVAREVSLAATIPMLDGMASDYRILDVFNWLSDELIRATDVKARDTLLKLWKESLSNFGELPSRMLDWSLALHIEVLAATGKRPEAEALATGLRGCVDDPEWGSAAAARQVRVVVMASMGDPNKAIAEAINLGGHDSWITLTNISYSFHRLGQHGQAKKALSLAADIVENNDRDAPIPYEVMEIAMGHAMIESEQTLVWVEKTVALLETTDRINGDHLFYKLARKMPYSASTQDVLKKFALGIEDPLRRAQLITHLAFASQAAGADEASRDLAVEVDSEIETRAGTILGSAYLLGRLAALWASLGEREAALRRLPLSGRPNGTLIPLTYLSPVLGAKIGREIVVRARPK